jgi:hypothetical protein
LRYTTATQIDNAVRKYFAKQGCVVLSEVRNGTGFRRAPRTADVIVVSTWPSRGLYASGIEIKVSRADLQHELAAPEKADDIARYCRHWWLAVPDDLLTDALMVPELWGILEVTEVGKIRVKRPAGTLKPVEMDSLFVCSLLRNFADSHVHVSEIQPQIAAAKTEAIKAARIDREYKLEQLTAGYERFKQHSGVDLLEAHGHPIWDMEKVGEAVRLIASLPGKTVRELVDAQNTLRACADALTPVLLLMGDQVLPKQEIPQ